MVKFLRWTGSLWLWCATKGRLHRNTRLPACAEKKHHPRTGKSKHQIPQNWWLKAKQSQEGKQAGKQTDLKSSRAPLRCCVLVGLPLTTSPSFVGPYTVRGSEVVQKKPKLCDKVCSLDGPLSVPCKIHPKPTAFFLGHPVNQLVFA